MTAQIKRRWKFPPDVNNPFQQPRARLAQQKIMGWKPFRRALAAPAQQIAVKGRVRVWFCVHNAGYYYT